MTAANSLSICPVVLDDTESLARLYELTIPDAFEREGLGHLQSDILQEIKGKMLLVKGCLDPQNTDSYFWVARIDGNIVGTISYAPCGEDIRVCTGNRLNAVGELGSLYILPEFQGQGIGSALIEEVLAFLRQQGIGQFCLDSGYRRAQARWLRKFGEPYAVVKDYWGPDSVHMVWLCNV